MIIIVMKVTTRIKYRNRVSRCKKILIIFFFFFPFFNATLIIIFLYSFTSASSAAKDGALKEIVFKLPSFVLGERLIMMQRTPGVWVRVYHACFGCLILL